jgi:hypothetical protein
MKMLLDRWTTPHPSLLDRLKIYSPQSLDSGSISRTAITQIVQTGHIRDILQGFGAPELRLLSKLRI